MTPFVPFLKYMAERAKERSTWVGISILGAAIGLHVDPDHMAKIVETASELLGLVLILTKDK